MAVIAASTVTSNPPANAGSGAANAGASASRDVFAAMLDQLADDLTGGMATIAADALSPSDTSDSAQDDAATTPAALATPPAPGAGTTQPAQPPMLAALLAFQQAAPNTQPTVSAAPPAAKPTDTTDTDANVATDDTPKAVPAAQPTETKPGAPAVVSPPSRGNPETAHGANDTPITAAKADASAPAKPDVTTAAKPDPITPSKPLPRDNLVRDSRQRPDGRVSAKDRHNARADAAQPNDVAPNDPARMDPALSNSAPTDPTPGDAAAPTLRDPAQAAQLVDTGATATITPPAASAPPPQATAPAIPAVDTNPVVAEAVAAALPATDQAATPVVTAGTITKPGKTGVASSDNSKSEGRTTRASALADAGDIAKRGFASEPLVRAAALPVQDKPDDADKPAPNGATAPQHNAANPAAAATPAQPAPVAEPAQVSPSAAAAHTQAAPQPDPGVSIATINSGASPTQTPATPAHIAAQIQVSQHTPDVNALAVTIAAKSEDGQKHFDIRLDPAELGRVDVRLSVDDAGKAQAMLSVEKPQTLELLQKDQTHLERALKDAGLDLTQNGLSFSLKGQQQQQQNAQDHTPFARGQRLSAHAAAVVQDIKPTLSTNGISASETRLDIRV